MQSDDLPRDIQRPCRCLPRQSRQFRNRGTKQGEVILSLGHSHSDWPFEDRPILSRWCLTTSHAHALPKGRASKFCQGICFPGDGCYPDLLSQIPGPATPTWREGYLAGGFLFMNISMACSSSGSTITSAWWPTPVIVAAFSRVGHSSSSSSDPSCGTLGPRRGEMKWISKESNG